MLAKCPAGKHVLLGGLGVLGVGEMWQPASDARQQSPQWVHLPIRPCRDFQLRTLCVG